MQLTPREFDKLLVYMMADVALKRRAKGLKLNYPEAVAVISAVALDGARAGKTIEDVTKEARTVLTKADVIYLPGKLGETTNNKIHGDLLVVRSNFKIRRSDFGIRAGEFLDKVARRISRP